MHDHLAAKRNGAAVDWFEAPSAVWCVVLPRWLELALLTSILDGDSGVVFAVDEWTEVTKRIKTPDKKLHVLLPDLLAELRTLLGSPEPTRDAAFPFVLTAGERRSFTANTIIRDPQWRKKDAGGALRIPPEDAAVLGVASGDPVRLTTRRDSVVVAIEISDTMQPGHVALPRRERPAGRVDPLGVHRPLMPVGHDDRLMQQHFGHAHRRHELTRELLARRQRRRPYPAVCRLHDRYCFQ